MQQSKGGYIYKTTNLCTGHVYIGQKLGEFNPKYRGSGVLILREIHKHGEENFKVEVICVLSTKKQLDQFEKFIIAKYREVVGKYGMYNIAEGGEGGNTFKDTPEDHKRMSDICKCRKAPWNKGLTKEDNPIINRIGFQRGRPSWNSGKKGLYKASELAKKRMSIAAKKAINPGRFVKGDKRLVGNTNAVKQQLMESTK